MKISCMTTIFKHYLHLTSRTNTTAWSTTPTSVSISITNSCSLIPGPPVIIRGLITKQLIWLYRWQCITLMRESYRTKILIDLVIRMPIILGWSHEDNMLFSIQLILNIKHLACLRGQYERIILVAKFVQVDRRVTKIIMFDMFTVNPLAHEDRNSFSMIIQDPYLLQNPKIKVLSIRHHVFFDVHVIRLYTNPAVLVNSTIMRFCTKFKTVDVVRVVFVNVAVWSVCNPLYGFRYRTWGARQFSFNLNFITRIRFFTYIE